MGTQTSGEGDFNVIQFEKRLTSLKDSQDHINSCCKWCLENRQHHKKIVTSWLNVLKRVKVEQRVNLFYLANDVIQYSKRRNYEFVDSWGTALQKATTLVRDDKVKHKIVRIFNIWQQRGVYNEEFISDLCGLISVVPTAPKNDEPHEFQASYVINKIKHCSKLENETDLKLKELKEHNPKIQIETESLCPSLKDRAHVDDVEKEVDNYVKHLEGYINCLKAEIKCRIANISVLKLANVQLEKDKRDVKVVANAYKMFAQRIKAFQKKLEEHKSTLTSPVPSPDINAPSPSPDSDIDLPDDDKKPIPAAIFNPSIPFTTGFYTPVPPPSTEGSSSFVTNGYTSFIGSNFSIESLNSSSLFTSTQSTPTMNTSTEVTNSSYNLDTDLSSVLQSLTQPPPPPVEAAPADPSSNYPYQSAHLPLLPPPVPLFAENQNFANNTEKSNFNQPYTPTDSNYNSSAYETSQVSSFDSSISDFPGTSFEPPVGANPYPPGSEEYNPEQDLETWDTDVNWAPPSLDTDTPESPPMFEKEGYTEPIEYHDTANTTGASDVDHRVLHGVTPHIDNLRGRGKDVDHRNLISLTGSPADTNTTAATSDIWNQQTDQDYRQKSQPAPAVDQDYRLPPSFNIEQLKLPPPPPPPPKPNSAQNKKQSPSPRKGQDVNVENVDMDLSEDESELTFGRNSAAHKDNSFVGSLKPPPPFPDLPDDVDANSFLDDLDNDLNSNEFTANLPDVPPQNNMQFNAMRPPPPRPSFLDGMGQGHFNMAPPQHNLRMPPPTQQNMSDHMDSPHEDMSEGLLPLPPNQQDGMRGSPFNSNQSMMNMPHNNWGGKPRANFGFRGANRGGFAMARGGPRGRPRGNFNFRGGYNFRGRGFGRGNPGKPRGNMRGNYQGGF